MSGHNGSILESYIAGLLNVEINKNVELYRTRSLSQSSLSSFSIFSKGDFVIVSTDDAPAVVMGPVIEVDEYGKWTMIEYIVSLVIPRR